MEGMIGEFEVAVENETETAALQPTQPGVYVQEAGAVSDTADGGFCIDEDGRETTATTDAEPMAARTKADILLESLSLADEQTQDSFIFATQVAPAKGDSDGDGAADETGGGDGDDDDGSGGTDGGGGGGILIGLLLPAVADDGVDDDAAFQLDLATGMEPLTSHSEIAFVPEPNELDGEFSIGLLDPSL